MNQAIQTPKQHHYLARLLGFDYSIHYRKGKTNVVVDALSRSLKDQTAALYALSTPQFLFLEDLRKELLSLPEFTALRDDIQANPIAYPEHTLNPGFILHKGRIWLSSNSSFIKPLLKEFHQSPTGGHMGIQKTLHCLQDNFTWNIIRDDTRAFVASCLTCQLTKYDNQKPAGLLCPLPVLAQPWEDLSMDFIIGPPAYHGNACIFVVVDRFSKGLHLGMLPINHTAHTIFVLFMEMVGKLHGMPRSIVSDRDPLFINKFWRELFSLSGTRLRLSSAYHPQSDGQTEVANRIIEQYLRAFVHQKPAAWGRYLLWVEWSYNTSCHSTTGLTPFEITFGRKPPTFPQYVTGTSKIDAVDDILSQREAVFALLHHKLLKAQSCMKAVADTHCRDQEYQVGDWVLVKLRQHRQSSATGTTYSKLTKCYYGPFQVTERMGKVAYKLQLPEHSRIHPVFHCSLLKPYVASNTPTDAADLPPMAVDNHHVITPLAIVASKLIPSEFSPKKMVLIQWKGMPLEETSWEEWSTFKTIHHLEDKVLLDGQGSDTNGNDGRLQKAKGVHEENNARPTRKKTAPTYLEDYVRSA